MASIIALDKSSLFRDDSGGPAPVSFEMSSRDTCALHRTSLAASKRACCLAWTNGKCLLLFDAVRPAFAIGGPEAVPCRKQLGITALIYRLRPNFPKVDKWSLPSGGVCRVGCRHKRESDQRCRSSTECTDPPVSAATALISMLRFPP